MPEVRHDNEGPKQGTTKTRNKEGQRAKVPETREPECQRPEDPKQKKPKDENARSESAKRQEARKTRRPGGPESQEG